MTKRCAFKPLIEPIGTTPVRALPGEFYIEGPTNNPYFLDYSGTPHMIGGSGSSTPVTIPPDMLTKYSTFRYTLASQQLIPAFSSRVTEWGGFSDCYTPPGNNFISRVLSNNGDLLTDVNDGRLTITNTGILTITARAFFLNDLNAQAADNYFQAGILVYSTVTNAVVYKWGSTTFTPITNSGNIITLESTNNVPIVASMVPCKVAMFVRSRNSHILYHGPGKTEVSGSFFNAWN